MGKPVFAAVTLKALAADPTIPQETKDALASLITMGNTTVAAPAPVRTFATKAERAAGNGFACPKCARVDLRVAPVAGRSFHEKDYRGNRAEICDFR